MDICFIRGGSLFRHCKHRHLDCWGKPVMAKWDLDTALDGYRKTIAEYEKTIAILRTELEQKENAVEKIKLQMQSLTAAHSVNEFRKGLEALINEKL